MLLKWFYLYIKHHIQAFFFQNKALYLFRTFCKCIACNLFPDFFYYFLKEIEQAINVVIPQQGKAVYEAVKDIIEGFKHILKNPKEALMKIGGSIFK